MFRNQYGRQDITSNDIDAVLSVLKSDCLTQGPMVRAFEAQICARVEARYATVANSATSALHLACLAFEITEESLVWVSAVSFVATANCAVMCGATVDFVDIDEQTCNLSVVALAEKLEVADRNGSLPDLLIVTHLSGIPADMENIRNLSRRYRFKILEDASHALGAKNNGNIVGSCSFSDAAVFSFHPVKMITCGEGGVVVSNDGAFDNLCKLYREHGIERIPGSFNQFDQLCLGYNYRLHDIGCALGLSQLERLDQFIEKRRRVVDWYRENLDPRVVFQRADENDSPTYHLAIIKIRQCAIEKKQRVYSEMRELGVGVSFHYRPIYQHTFYRKLNTEYISLRGAETFYAEALTLPCHVHLEKRDLLVISDSLSKSLDSIE